MESPPRPAEQLLSLYGAALPEVYGYLINRCGDRAVAEDLASETFLAVVRGTTGPPGEPITVAWLVGVARHKLADHWRRSARHARPGPPKQPEAEDPWEAELDHLRCEQVLDRLAPEHRAVLTLRYLDGLPVAEVAGLLGRSLPATESLLARARSAFRRRYEEGEHDGR